MASQEPRPAFQNRTAALVCLVGVLIGGAALGVGGLAFALGEVGWTPDSAAALNEVRSAIRTAMIVEAGLAVVGCAMIVGGVVLHRRGSRSRMPFTER